MHEVFLKLFLLPIFFCFVFLFLSPLQADLNHHADHSDHLAQASPKEGHSTPTKNQQKVTKISLADLIDQASVENTNLKFKLLEGDKSLLENDLEVVHERKIHMLIFDESLTEFQHLHPLSANGYWEAMARFTHKGDYRLFVQGQTKSGHEFNLPWKIKVTSGKDAHLIPKKLPVNLSGRDQESKVSLESLKFVPKKMYMINIKFSREDGKPPKITPYLGAIAHVVSIRLGGHQLLHVHPMEGKTPDSAVLHVEFPEKGYYRLWIQYNDHEILRTVPLSLIVGKP